MQHRKLTFIGAGNMALDIVAGLVNGGYPVYPILSASAHRAPHDGMCWYSAMALSAVTTTSQTRRMLTSWRLAVKPQLMASVCKPLHSVLNAPGKLVLSIAAGVSVASFQALLGKPLMPMRIMPNTLSLVGKGLSGLYAPANVSAEDRAFSAELMQSVGKVCWVEQESGINGVIAAAGSAPAYFFLFMEAIQQEAIRQGFTPESARQLLQQAALGATALGEASPDTRLAKLREYVTSKVVTTAEALWVFNERQLI